MKITKSEWTDLGGMMNPDCYRKHSAGRWHYYRSV
jgi:hypothetical protein